MTDSLRDRVLAMADDLLLAPPMDRSDSESAHYVACADDIRYLLHDGLA